MSDTKVQLPDVSRFSAVDETENPQQLIEVLDVAKRLPGFPAASCTSMSPASTNSRGTWRPIALWDMALMMTDKPRSVRSPSSSCA